MVNDVIVTLLRRGDRNSLQVAMDMMKEAGIDTERVRIAIGLDNDDDRKLIASDIADSLSSDTDRPGFTSYEVTAYMDGDSVKLQIIGNRDGERVILQDGIEPPRNLGNDPERRYTSRHLYGAFMLGLGLGGVFTYLYMRPSGVPNLNYGRDIRLLKARLDDMEARFGSVPAAPVYYPPQAYSPLPATYTPPPVEVRRYSSPMPTDDRDLHSLLLSEYNRMNGPDLSGGDRHPWE